MTDEEKAALSSIDLACIRAGLLHRNLEQIRAKASRDIEYNAADALERFDNLLAHFGNLADTVADCRAHLSALVGTEYDDDPPR